MSTITVFLKDKTQKNMPEGTTGQELAALLSPRLAREAVCVRINGVLSDLTLPLPDQSCIEILTRHDPECLEILRHDAAHVMAEAVQELYPNTQVTIGPAIENGFYYDFHREIPFTPEDLIAIEDRMKEIVDRDEAIRRQEMSREEALSLFLSKGETFKAELIESIPPADILSVYTQGSFVDLCRGPHLPSTGRLGKAFKLMSVAGSYWRGDHRRDRLQRIYGTAWASDAQLQTYLLQLEEAEKRDHRKLGKELSLFHLQEESPGSVFWHPKGWTLYKTLERFLQKKLQREGYQEVKTPQILDRSLWEASGHWEKFKENMFVVDSENKTLAIKPMNCPCHVQIFKQGLKSYRDLPLRMAEFGACHRNEPSGALHGLMRVRAFVQDDAHIFCTPEQIISETKAFCHLLKEVYDGLGFTDIRVKFSDRPDNRAGSEDQWDRSEKALWEAAIASGLDCTLNPAEGAFYGPKLEFVLRDALGRDWQCGTLQVDFILPQRLGASYIDEHGEKQTPVMLHRAILGSFERFIGVLIEHYGGKFPLWLAPVQVVVMPVTNGVNAYAQHVFDQLTQRHLRGDIDLRNEKIPYKIREWSLQKVPVILVVGQKEADTQSVTLRRLGHPNQETMSLEEALSLLYQEAQDPLFLS